MPDAIRVQGADRWLRYNSEQAKGMTLGARYYGLGLVMGRGQSYGDRLWVRIDPEDRVTAVAAGAELGPARVPPLAVRRLTPPPRNASSGQPVDRRVPVVASLDPPDRPRSLAPATMKSARRPGAGVLRLPASRAREGSG